MTKATEQNEQSEANEHYTAWMELRQTFKWLSRWSNVDLQKVNIQDLQKLIEEVTVLLMDWENVPAELITEWIEKECENDKS